MNGNRTKMEKIKITRWPLKDRISRISNEQSSLGGRIESTELNYSLDIQKKCGTRRWTKWKDILSKFQSIYIYVVCVRRSTIFLKFISRAEQIFNIFRMEKIKLKILNWKRWQGKRIKAIALHFTIDMNFSSIIFHQ